MIQRASILALVSLLSATSAALAQGGGSISGVVKDSAGGVIPGASVVAKNNATGTTFETATNNEGVYNVPALDAGVYTLTVKLEGFKTAIVANVRVSPGTQTAANAVLEIGTLAETVNVQSSGELINTQTPTISSTLNVDQVNQMPLPSRNALNAVTFLPGVNTAGVNRDSTVNGLPQSFINITMDGVSNNDNFLKSSDGFFASVTPRQDAIEAVTVTTAVGAADTGGHGAVTINFQTRQGTNRFTGSLYEYFRHKALNTNYWFNERNGLPRNDVKLNQYGVRQGGPIIIPGLYDGQGKAFFFFNYEELRLPNDFTRTRSVLHPRAQQGWFRYTVTAADGSEELREVNVMTLAAGAGHSIVRDPMVDKLLGFINAATQSQGVLNATSNPMLMDYVWQSPGYQWERQPVVRIDYNITQKHRLSGTYNQLWAQRDPDQLNGADARFPGGPNYRLFWSTRPTRSFTLRSTLTSNLVSEARVGITKGGTSYFGKNQYEGRGVPQFDDMDGYAIDFDSDIGVTNWWTTNSPSWRAAYQYTFDETLTWQKGKHGLSLGGSAFLGRTFENAQTLVPSIQLGFDSDRDPARGIFNGTNFRGASSGELTDARQLYGLLTGRVVSVGGQAVLDPETGTYRAFYPRTRQGKMDVYSLFLQDSWRTMPTLTINAGLRWDVQMPFKPRHDIFSQTYLEDACGMSGLGPNTTIYNKCNFLAPGSSGGKVPQFYLLGAGDLGYNIDWNNLAPNVGVNWRPNVQDGWLRTLLGDPEQAVLRAGYSVSFERQGLGEFTGLYGSNPGATLSLTRSATSAEPLVPAGQNWPVLLTERHRLQPASFPERPTYPIAVRANRADSLNLFAPDIEIGGARTWTVSFQRAITRNTAIDARYVGTRGVNQWSELNYNSIRGENIVVNGFINEFRLAQANLAANNAAGGDRLGSVAYFGPGTGTHPLPTYVAYIQGRPRSDATNPAIYTNSLWTNTSFAGRHVYVNPSVTGAAGDLDGNTTRRANAINAGLPANYFVPNPAVSSVNVTDSGAFSDYHALQVELRRRMSRGLQVNGSYQYALEGGSAFLGFSHGRVMDPSSNVRHAFKTQWDWTIPVGRGQRFGNEFNPILNALLGGWKMNGVGRVQAVTVNFGNVRLVGMTAKDLQKMFRHDIRINPANGLRTVYMLPDDVIQNTRRAFSTSSETVSGYGELGAPEGRYIAPANSADCIQTFTGECAPRTLLIRAPWFTRFDIGVTKRFPIHGHVNADLRIDVLNVFDNVNFDLASGAGSGSTIFQVGSAYRDPSNTFDPGGRLGQLVFRLNW